MTSTDDVQTFAEALRAVRGRSEAPLAFGGPLRGGSIAVERVVGGHTRSLSGLQVLPGRGLGGQVLRSPRLLSVDDYGVAPTITHDYDRQVLTEGVRALTAAPVMVNGTVRGVIYVASKTAGLPGDMVTVPLLDVTRSLARQLAIGDEVERRVRRALAEASLPHIPEPEGLDELHTELCDIAAEVDDPVLQRRVTVAAGRLAQLGSGAAAATTPPDAPLSPRERDVLAEVALGYTNAEAAVNLEVRPETVKAYLRSASSKLGVHGRYQAVLAARRTGQLPGTRAGSRETCAGPEHAECDRQSQAG